MFSISALREPKFLVDIDIHNLEVLNVQDLPQNTGWGKVPTPSFQGLSLSPIEEIPQLSRAYR